MDYGKEKLDQDDGSASFRWKSRESAGPEEWPPEADERSVWQMLLPVPMANSWNTINVAYNI